MILLVERPHRAAVRLNPRNFNSLFSLAGQAASQGRRQDSLDYLRRCAALNPEKTRTLWRDDLSSPLRKFGDFARDPEFLRLLGPDPD